MKAYDELLGNYYTSRSDLGSQMQVYLEYFSLDQFLILDYKDISQNPANLLKKTFSFLNLKQIDVADELLFSNFQHDNNSVQKNKLQSTPQEIKDLKPALRIAYKKIIDANARFRKKMKMN